MDDQVGTPCPCLVFVLQSRLLTRRAPTNARVTRTLAPAASHALRRRSGALLVKHVPRGSSPSASTATTARNLRRAYSGQEPFVGGRCLHSFTSQLNLSAFYGIGGGRKGSSARVKGVLGGVKGVKGVFVC
jgi:hypothetical protein